MTDDAFFAIAYRVLPELREEYAFIMRGFWVRAICAGLGAIWVYAILRRGVGSRTRLMKEFPLRFVVGIVPGCLLWLVVECLAGGYWYWEAVGEGAEREIILGGVGLASWSFVLGSWFLALADGESLFRSPTAGSVATSEQSPRA